jgi:hypothetical protein
VSVRARGLGAWRPAYDLHWVDPAASSPAFVRTFSETDIRGGAGSFMPERALPDDR